MACMDAPRGMTADAGTGSSQLLRAAVQRLQLHYRARFRESEPLEAFAFMTSPAQAEAVAAVVPYLCAISTW